jgi:hypothetical protein
LKIESYSFGKIVIDGVTFNRDLKLFPDRVLPNWWRKEGHFLECEDMDDVFSFEPEAIVIGTGMLGAMKVSKRVKDKCAEKGIELLIEKTEKAVKIFNQISGSKKTVGLFHLTC